VKCIANRSQFSDGAFSPERRITFEDECPREDNTHSLRFMHMETEMGAQILSGAAILGGKLRPKLIQKVSRFDQEFRRYVIIPARGTEQPKPIN
jgi:hypothetical protein